jgi:hypothetical protein
MVATPAAPAIPVVELVRHRAIHWSVAERAEMQRQLEPFGVSITELSDTRERCGLPRLSSTDAKVRWAAPHLLRSERGQAALADVRAERARLTEALATFHRDTVANARHLLQIRRASPSCLRLGELQALFCQCRLIELRSL